MLAHFCTDGSTFRQKTPDVAETIDQTEMSEIIMYLVSLLSEKGDTEVSGFGGGCAVAQVQFSPGVSLLATTGGAETA